MIRSLTRFAEIAPIPVFRRTRAALAVVLALAAAGCLRLRSGGETYNPPESNLESRAAFMDAAFGLAPEWAAGPPSNQAAAREAAAEWAKLASGAGADYIAITPPPGDLAEPFVEFLVKEGRRRGIAVFLRTPDGEAPPEGLIKRLEPPGGLAPAGPEGGEDPGDDAVRRLHRVSSSLLAGGPWRRKPRHGRDFGSVRAADAEDLDPAAGGDDFPLELTAALGEDDGRLRAPEIVEGIVRAAGSGANYRLSFPAGPEGRIAYETAEPLRETGRWLARNGESLRRTRRGPVEPSEWGVTTRRENRIFVHYLLDRGGSVSIPAEIGGLRKCYFFINGAPKDAIVSGDRYILEFEDGELTDDSTIVVLEVTPPEPEEEETVR